jgi:hypothetical protein
VNLSTVRLDIRQINLKKAFTTEDTEEHEGKPKTFFSNILIFFAFFAALRE